MKKSLIFIILSIFSIMWVSAQNNVDYYPQVINCIRNGDFETCSKLLDEWSKDVPVDDPQLAIAYFNFYVNRSAVNGSAIQKDSSGRYVMGAKQFFDEVDFAKGLEYLANSLKKNPNRLDMHKGRISASVQNDDFARVAEFTNAMLNQSLVNKNKWLWDENVPLEEYSVIEENFMLQTFEDSSFFLMKRFKENKTLIKSLIDKAYSNYSKNNLTINVYGRFLAQDGQFDKAIQIYKQGMENDPEDYIVLGNLGYVYEQKGQYDKARETYNQMLKMPYPEAVQYGQEYLQGIEGK